MDSGATGFNPGTMTTSGASDFLVHKLAGGDDHKKRKKKGHKDLTRRDFVLDRLQGEYQITVRRREEEGKNER